MCSISGGIMPCNLTEDLRLQFDRDLKRLISNAEDRGRDSWGVAMSDGTLHRELGRASEGIEALNFKDAPGWIINNNRAEPTTEYVKEKRKEDIQPFTYKGWYVAHNGVIANDKELRKEYGLNDATTKIDSAVIPELLAKEFGDNFEPAGVIHFLHEKLIGSYALAIAHENYPDTIMLMCNYKPLYLATSRTGGYMLFTSLETYLHDHQLSNHLFGDLVVAQVPAYTGVVLYQYPNRIELLEIPLEQPSQNKKALVVCSGGLDSTVVAAVAKHSGYDVTLLHFLYKCRAESKEQQAVKNIAERLQCDYVFIDTDIFKNTIGGSRLTETLDEAVAEGEAGAEFAHEWVPARNLIMLSIAVGYAESKGYGTIMLGNNLEESGAYPDNEMIFINKLNEVLPYATQVNKHVRIEMPVGNLMKWEIVKLGLEVNAPLDLCWSCYEAGELHCGHCGPCFMRRTAFEINGVPEVIKYADEEETTK